MSNLYEVNKKRFKTYYESFQNESRILKEKVLSFRKESSKNYIFGAHLFTQFLISFGLDEELFDNVLDNNPTKENKRLYGSNLISMKPNIIKKDKKPLVVLRAGSYNEEIKEQLLAINKNSIIITL